MKRMREITIGGHIFAAGFGTRMKPITNTTPKPLIKIHGKPIIQYSLDLLSSIPEMNTITINTFHLAEQFNYLHNEKKKVFVYKEPYILGHAKTLELCNKYHTEDVIIGINSDTIYNFPVNFLQSCLKDFCSNSSGTDLGLITKKDDTGPIAYAASNIPMGVYKNNGIHYYTDSKEVIKYRRDAIGIFFFRKELYQNLDSIYGNQKFVGIFGVDDLLENLLRKKSNIYSYELNIGDIHSITSPNDIRKLNKLYEKNTY